MLVLSPVFYTHREVVIMKEEGFKYYAFISYSHKDKKTAQRLHKRLRSYHLPSKLIQSHPELPKKLGEVFLDEDVKLDYIKAIEYYEKAAANGNTSAQTMFGSIYCQGWAGVKRDDYKGIE